MQLTLNKGFKQRAKGRFQKYEFEVGVLQDGPHRIPKTGARGKKGQDVLTTYAGTTVRKASRKAGPLTVSEVSEANRQRMTVNYLTEPFKNRSAAIVKFSQEFFKLLAGKAEKKRAENLLQGIVRNPILRNEYGSNSRLTQKIKGFNHRLMDTGQLFKAIKAICRIRGR